MRVTVLLADSAQEVGGKIYALGLGWSTVVTPTPQLAVIILLDIDWNETNHKFALRAELVDSDMQPVVVQTPMGEQPVYLEGHVEAGRAPGLPHGTPSRVPFTALFGPLNLNAGARYEWRVTIDGEHEEGWSESFTVMG